MKRKIRVIRWLMLPVWLLILSSCANGVFYQPSTRMWPAPDTRGYAYEDVYFTSEDDLKLHGWWLPSQQPDPKGTVLHFHGNAQNMTTHVQFAEWLTGEGYHLFVFDYRGYGQSEGSPKRKGLVKDGMAALDYASTREEAGGLPFYVWGQSLGGTVALQSMLHSDVTVNAALIDSTFYSHGRIASDKLKTLPWFFQILRPIRPLLVWSGWDAESAVRKLEGVPLAFMHGEADRVIPSSHTPMLHALAPEGTPLWMIPGARHCMAVLSHAEEVRPGILSFFEAHKEPLLDSGSSSGKE